MPEGREVVDLQDSVSRLGGFAVSSAVSAPGWRPSAKALLTAKVSFTCARISVVPSIDWDSGWTSGPGSSRSMPGSTTGCIRRRSTNNSMLACVKSPIRVPLASIRATSEAPPAELQFAHCETGRLLPRGSAARLRAGIGSISSSWRWPSPSGCARRRTAPPELRDRAGDVPRRRDQRSTGE